MSDFASSTQSKRSTARPHAGSPALRSNLIGLVRTMRIKQWTKNAFVLAGVVFDGKLMEPEMVVRALVAFIGFCFASSAVYLFNDLVDMEKDRQHPRKRLRPLPAGQLNPRLAAFASALLAVAAVGGVMALDFWTGVIVLSYLLLNVAYSFQLKHLVIIDVMMIALFFVLRAAAGAVVVDAQNFSPWLYVCATLGALILGFGKRRHEIALLEDDASSHRASLEHYTLPFLDQMIGIVVTSVLVAYTLYSIEAKTALAGEGQMLLTVPFLLYGMFRYLYLVHVKRLGGAPEDLLFKDMPFLGAILLWGFSVVAVIYFW